MKHLTTLVGGVASLLLTTSASATNPFVTDQFAADPTAPSWVRFNEVDFGRGGQKAIEVRAKAGGKGALEVRLNSQDGPVIARVRVGGAVDWTVAEVGAQKVPAGVHDLFVMQTGTAPVEVDWMKFR